MSRKTGVARWEDYTFVKTSAVDNNVVLYRPGALFIAIKMEQNNSNCCVFARFLLVPSALNELGRMSSALQASLNQNVSELLTPL